MTSVQNSPVRPSGAPRPLRKDALRNRSLLLAAAREVFAERGIDASLDDIAHRAGLGVGTAYRHFANKQEIVAALSDEAIDNLIRTLGAAQSIANPLEALVSFLEGAAVSQAKDRGLHQILMGAVPHDHDALRRRFEQPMSTLLERAKAAGVIRSDVVVNDIAMVFAMLGIAFELHGESSPESWRRYLTILLDGLQATDRPPLPVPALSNADIDAAMTEIKFRRC
jgi:AcrR family transcriptional regulator